MPPADYACRIAQVLNTIAEKLVFGENTNPTVEVNFERPTPHGFDSARCELPSYHWIERTGYSDEEIEEFLEFLKNNAHLIFLSKIHPQNTHYR